MEDKGKATELIRKLLALSTSPNEHEARLAMSKAQELLMKHNLDMAAINTGPNGNGNNDEALINEIVDFDKWQPWRWTLLSVIAKTNFCQTIRSGKDIHILGRKANVRCCQELYNWIEPQILRLAEHSPYVRLEKTSYILGIIRNLQESLKATREQHVSSNPESRALIVSLEGELQSWYKEEYPRVRSGTGARVSQGAFSQGQSDSGKVSIYGNNRQVAGGVRLLS